MIMMSMFLWRVWTPGSDWQCITLANKSKLVLVWKYQAETTAHVTTKTKDGLCQGFGDQFKTLTEGGYFWIWQKVASYVWFLCYLLWNNITVMASHLGSPFMISMKEKIAWVPLRATPLRRMAVMALLMSSSLSRAELTCTTSKSTGTQLNLQKKCTKHTLNHPNNLKSTFGMLFKTYFLANLKTSLTWLSSSGPMPFPGMSVTVCLPPYFAGGGCKVELCRYCNLMQILKIK